MKSRIEKWKKQIETIREDGKYGKTRKNMKQSHPEKLKQISCTLSKREQKQAAYNKIG